MILSYARRNDIEQATKYFNMMESQYCLSPSVRSYNAMIYAHSNDGNVQGALRYLEKMIIAKI
jgi:pentatricopeptide repeat protein